MNLHEFCAFYLFQLGEKVKKKKVDPGKPGSAEKKRGRPKKSSIMDSDKKKYLEEEEPINQSVDDTKETEINIDISLENVSKILKLMHNICDSIGNLIFFFAGICEKSWWWFRRGEAKRERCYWRKGIQDFY